MTLTRDESGRLLAEDGYPAGGLATVQEVVTVSGLSKSKIYQMLTSGELRSKRYGRSVRIPWSEVRQAFLSDEIKT